MKKILLVQSNYPNFLNFFYKRIGNEKLGYQTLKNKWDQEWFGQGNFYSLNLKEWGWQGEEIIINDWKLQKAWSQEHHFSVNREEWGIVKTLPESLKNYLGLRGWIKKILFKQVQIEKPEVVYLHDLSVLGVQDLRRIKSQGCLVAGQIACPLPLNQKPLYEYDLIVSSFPHYVEKFCQMGINSEYLPWCFESSILKEIRPVSRIYNVVFIGGFGPAHSEGNRVLEELARKTKVDFWGYGVDTLPITSPIRQNYHGEVWGRGMYEVMNQSKIVVNRHINVAGNVANNMRMFDVTGMGALLITDDKPNMKEFFEVGKEVVVYTSPQDLVCKVKYYLAHPQEAHKIAKSGQKRTLKDHTYRLRMKQLAQILEKHLNEEKQS